MIKPQFFPSEKEFRKWLEKNHQSEQELLVGFYKVKSGKESMKWSESVDQAICFGWIDGVRKSIDEERYSIRFTPRKKDSIWSEINIQKVERLSKLGLMKEAGLVAFSYRKEHKSGIYSHEKKDIQLSSEYEKSFKKNKKAWQFFTQQAPSYRKQIIHWITSAKQEKTRLSRLEKAILTSESEKRIV